MRTPFHKDVIEVHPSYVLKWEYANKLEKYLSEISKNLSTERYTINQSFIVVNLAIYRQSPVKSPDIKTFFIFHERWSVS